MSIRIFEVGGSLRNELLGRPAKDRDFAVLAPDYQTMQQYLLDNRCTFYQERPQYVSIRARHPDLGAVDFTLARRESFYTDARHPDSVTPAHTIEEDLARRDFRMNAMAREVGSTKLIDPFDGQADIQTRIIRCVGETLDRFREDRLRVFRALRFACQLDFALSGSVEKGIWYWVAEDFQPVTAEMIQIELCKAFAADSFRACCLLHQFPILLAVLGAKKIWLKPTLEER